MTVIIDGTTGITSPAESVSGNLTFTGTGNRITGDFSNGTAGNRVAFQTSTVNGPTSISVIPNGTSAGTNLSAFNGTDAGNASYMRTRIDATVAYLESGTNGTGPNLPMTFYTGGSERVRVDTSGNVGIGTSTIGSAGVTLTSAYNIGWGQSAGESVPNIFRQTSSAATVLANGYRHSATSNGFASSFGSSFAKTAIALNEGTVRFYTDTAATTAAGTDVTPSERARIDSSGQMHTTNGAGVVAKAYDCRAWVNFNGTGTVAIRASGNVSSITDLGVGIYTVNFTTAMPDANYAVVAASRDSGVTATFTSAVASTSSQAIVNTQWPIGTNYDANSISASIFR